MTEPFCFVECSGRGRARPKAQVWLGTVAVLKLHLPSRRTGYNWTFETQQQRTIKEIETRKFGESGYSFTGHITASTVYQLVSSVCALKLKSCEALAMPGLQFHILSGVQQALWLLRKWVWDLTEPLPTACHVLNQLFSVMTVTTATFTSPFLQFLSGLRMPLATCREELHCKLRFLQVALVHSLESLNVVYKTHTIACIIRSLQTTQVS